MKFSNMEDLKKAAICVYERMVTEFPHFTQQIRFNISVESLKLEPLTYAYKNSVVAFVDESGELYVIPDLKGTQRVLLENGYRKAYFYVPFSNWDYPVIHKEKWESLWQEKNAETKK